MMEEALTFFLPILGVACLDLQGVQARVMETLSDFRQDEANFSKTSNDLVTLLASDPTPYLKKKTFIMVFNLHIWPLLLCKWLSN